MRWTRWTRRIGELQHSQAVLIVVLTGPVANLPPAVEQHGLAGLLPVAAQRHLGSLAALWLLKAVAVLLQQQQQHDHGLCRMERQSERQSDLQTRQQPWQQFQRAACLALSQEPEPGAVLQRQRRGGWCGHRGGAPLAALPASRRREQNTGDAAAAHLGGHAV